MHFYKKSQNSQYWATGYIPRTPYILTTVEHMPSMKSTASINVSCCGGVLPRVGRDMTCPVIANLNS